MEFMIRHRENNGNDSVVCLAENAFSSCLYARWMEYLATTELYGGQTSFGEIPRLQRYSCDGGEFFGMRAGWKDDGNDRWIARKYDDGLLEIQSFVQSYFDTHISPMNIPGVISGIMFDSCLANYYRSVKDSIKPHRDSEVIFGDNPTVMILSFGLPREIIFERILYDKDNLNSIKKDKTFCGGQKTTRIMMPARSILFMGGEVQKYYSHEIKKVFCDVLPEDEGSRHSLTFRQYHT